jgi:hypothetical protein
VERRRQRERERERERKELTAVVYQVDMWTLQPRGALVKDLIGKDAALLSRRAFYTKILLVYRKSLSAV